MNNNQPNKRKGDIALSEGSIWRASAVLACAIAVLLIITALFFIIANATRDSGGDEEITTEDKPSIPTNEPSDNGEDVSYPFRQVISISLPEYIDNSPIIPDSELLSQNAVLVDVTEGKVLASRQSKDLIFPASMTKVMSLIVVFENLKSADDLNDTVAVSEATYTRMVNEGASGFGFVAGETMTVKDAIYAMVLVSDGMASVTLAEYIAGSEANFVALMNAKAEEMGLENTNFANCTGLHSSNHYSTCRDVATIMTYAMKNTFCAEILRTQSYHTVTNIHSDGIWFYHGLLVTRIDEAKYAGITYDPNKADVIAGKTGFTDEAKQCLVSYALGDDGKTYVLVTANAPVKLDPVKDHMYIYDTFIN